jgi:hypothetical protein
LCVIPERGKATEDDVESARAKGRHVFDEYEARADFVDDSPEL